VKKIVFLILCLCKAYGEENSSDDGYWFRNTEFQKSLDEKTHSRGHSGNQVKLYVNGENSLKQRLANLANADVILIKAYEFWNDISSNEILDVLIDRTKQGAKVFIQFDVKGTFSGIKPDSEADLREGRLNPIPDYLQKFLQKSEGNGFVIPTTVPYSLLSTGSWVLKDHEKSFITWERKNQVNPVRVILGGMNIGDMYLLGGVKDKNGNFETVSYYQSEGFSGYSTLPMRDTDVEVIGTVTEDIVARYIDAAEFQLKNPNVYFQKEQAPHIQLALKELRLIQQDMLQNHALAFPENVGHALVRFIYKTAKEFGSREISNIQNFFISMLKQVPDHSTIQFATGYFLPTKLLWKAISEATHRGVIFDILSNRPQGPESAIASIALPARSQIRHYLKIVPSGSINFYEWFGNPLEGIGVVMHQKVYSFGLGENQPCAIGSANLNTMSLYWDSEDLLVIQEPDFKKQLDEMLRKDFTSPNSEKITMEQLKNESFLHQIKEFLINKFARDFL